MSRRPEQAAEPPSDPAALDYRDLTDDELRVAALEEALHGTDRLGDPLPPAIAEGRRRRGRR